MKNIPLIILLLFLPSLVFSQGTDAASIGFSAGVSAPTDFEIFTADHRSGFSVSAFVENNFTKYLTLGIGGSISSYPYKGIYTAGPHNYISANYYIKIQNNLLRDGKFQPFVKGGAGIFKGRENYEIEAPRLTLSGFSFLAGAGINYIIERGLKIFLEADYEYFVKSISSVQLKLGLSFCLNCTL